MAKHPVQETELAYYRWQTTRRNPKYISSYAQYTRGEMSSAGLLGEFGFATSYLIDPLHPHLDQQRIRYYKRIGTPEGYSPTPSTKDVDLSNRHESVYLKLFIPAVQIVLKDPQNYDLLKGDKYLTVNIDTSQKRKQVEAGLDSVLNYIWSKQQSQRDRLPEWETQLQVWDLRKQRKTYLQIAMELYPSETPKKSTERVRKQFRAAYEKIIGEEYDQLKYKELFKNKDLLPKTCDDCPSRNDCTEPCPEVLPYLDSDYVSLKESLQNNPPS